MTIKRITISVPASIAKRIKDAAGKIPVSTWVTERIEEHLEQEELDRLFEEFYRDVNPSPESVREADAMFLRLTGKLSRRAALSPAAQRSARVARGGRTPTRKRSGRGVA